MVDFAEPNGPNRLHEVGAFDRHLGRLDGDRRRLGGGVVLDEEVVFGCQILRDGADEAVDLLFVFVAVFREPFAERALDLVLRPRAAAHDGLEQQRDGAEDEREALVDVCVDERLLGLRRGQLFDRVKDVVRLAAELAARARTRLEEAVFARLERVRRRQEPHGDDRRRRQHAEAEGEDATGT